jgi:hypothetical protein
MQRMQVGRQPPVATPSEASEARAVEVAKIVSEYIPLTLFRGRLLGACPFHPDRGQNFEIVSRREARCWGCGWAGDAIRFVMRLERLDFGEAIRRTIELYDGARNRPPAREAPPPAWSAKATARWAAVDPDQLREHAKRLGIPAASLWELGFVPGPGGLLAPMQRVAGGHVVGMVREDGSLEDGSLLGLHLPRNFELQPGEGVVLCRGPLSAAALHSAGIDAIGWPLGDTWREDLLAQNVEGLHVTVAAGSEYRDFRRYERLLEAVAAKASSVSIVRIPDPFGSVHEWIVAGNAGLEEVAAGMQRLEVQEVAS